MQDRNLPLLSRSISIVMRSGSRPVNDLRRKEKPTQRAVLLGSKPKMGCMLCGPPFAGDQLALPVLDQVLAAIAASDFLEIADAALFLVHVLERLAADVVVLAGLAGDDGERLFHALVAAHVIELRHARKALAARLAVLARQNGDGCGSVLEIAAFVPIDVIGGCH